MLPNRTTRLAILAALLAGTAGGCKKPSKQHSGPTPTGDAGSIVSDLVREHQKDIKNPPTIPSGYIETEESPPLVDPEQNVEPSVSNVGTDLLSHYGDQPIHIATEIKEPVGLPQFAIYKDMYGLDHLPTSSPCKWVARRYDRMSWITFLPEGWIVDGEATTEKGGTVIYGGKLRIKPRDFERCNFPAYSSWAGILNGLLHAFATIPKHYQNGLKPDPEVTLAYGLLVGAYHIFDTGEPAHHDFRTRVLHSIYRSKDLLQHAYDWATPHLQATWAVMRTEDKELYLDILRHGQGYLKTFNYNAELAYLRRLEAGKCTKPNKRYKEWDAQWNSDKFHASMCTHQFVTVGPDGKPNPLRKIEAYIFRRVHQDGMTKAQISYWLDKVVDLLD